MSSSSSSSPALQFSILARDAQSQARLGRVTTLHGAFDTPAFMPVGTQATIKGLLPPQVAQLGAQIILANTYHLLLRPGSALVAKMGGGEGLHDWMGWKGPILTDSGGFQVFSLSDINRINDDGVTFRSHLDGALIELTPERSMQVQNELGADIIMAFDDCPPASWGESRAEDDAANSDGATNASLDTPEFPAAKNKTSSAAAGAVGVARKNKPYTPEEYRQRVQVANERTLRWMDRCVKAHARKQDQSLFGIVQGGTDLSQRTWCAERLTQHDLPGFAIGGVAVGEGFEGLKSVVQHTAPLLPQNKPRYLMGVGYERDILVAVRAGIDMFDCVLPTRNGRNANAFTSTGQMRLRNAKFADDPLPIEVGCDCIACGGSSGGSSGGGYSRSYIRHLFNADEMLGPILVSAHNIRHFQRFMLDIRAAIRDNNWSSLLRAWPVAAEPASGSQ